VSYVTCVNHSFEISYLCGPEVEISYLCGPEVQISYLCGPEVQISYLCGPEVEISQRRQLDEIMCAGARDARERKTKDLKVSERS